MSHWEAGLIPVLIQFPVHMLTPCKPTGETIGAIITHRSSRGGLKKGVLWPGAAIAKSTDASTWARQTYGAHLVPAIITHGNQGARMAWKLPRLASGHMCLRCVHPISLRGNLIQPLVWIRVTSSGAVAWDYFWHWLSWFLDFRSWFQLPGYARRWTDSARMCRSGTLFFGAFN